MKRRTVRTYMEYLAKFLCALFLIFLLWLVLDYNDILNHKNINKTLEAGVYTEGIKMEDISVVVDGKYYPKLWKPDIFIGKFSVSFIPETMEDFNLAEIVWYDKYQLITFYENKHGQIEIVDTYGSDTIMIDCDMNEFVWIMKSGEVIATSDEIYQTYMKSKNQTE